MFLKYMNKGMEFVRTIDWKKEVKQWEVFETPDMIWEWLMRNYKWMFEIVEEDKKETKVEKKTNGWKKLKK